MNDYKIIVLGSQCSGKSTLIKYLQEHTDLVCVDHDEEIKKRNGGTYPKDPMRVNNELLPQIERYVLEQPRVIYTASFWGLGDRDIDNERIATARRSGFKFANFMTDKETLLERNRARVKQGKDDASVSFDWYQKVYRDMEALHPFDLKLDGSKPIEEIANELLQFIQQAERA